MLLCNVWVNLPIILQFCLLMSFFGGVLILCLWQFTSPRGSMWLKIPIPKNTSVELKWVSFQVPLGFHFRKAHIRCRTLQIRQGGCTHLHGEPTGAITATLIQQAPVRLV